jgi:hypothetical protein
MNLNTPRIDSGEPLCDADFGPLPKPEPYFTEERSRDWLVIGHAVVGWLALLGWFLVGFIAVRGWM